MTELQVFLALAQICASLLIAWTAWRVYRYTRRRDGASFIGATWSMTGEINKLLIADQSVRESYERIIYGDDYEYDDARAKTYAILLYRLNELLGIFRAGKRGLIPQHDVDAYIAPRVRLLARQRSAVEYLLCHRGYEREFTDYLVDLLRSAKPVEAQSKVPNEVVA